MGNGLARYSVASLVDKDGRAQETSCHTSTRGHGGAHAQAEYPKSSASNIPPSLAKPTHLGEPRTTKAPLRQPGPDFIGRRPTAAPPAPSTSSSSSLSSRDSPGSSPMTPPPMDLLRRPSLSQRMLGCRPPTLALSPSPGPMALSPDDLTNSTAAFRVLLGAGGFGQVFKGHVRNAQTKEIVPVAVKVLTSADGECMEADVMREIVAVDGLCHPHILRLLGYCTEGCFALVYEFMPGGDVEQRLRACRRGQLELPWACRMKVALGCAQALAAMHERGIVHRDFKASNVLLTEELSPRVADFGLVKPMDRGHSHVSTHVKGTIGYIDPLYFALGHVHCKSDVYAFGVFLVELVSGKSVHRDNLYETVIASIAQGKVARPLVREALDASIPADDARVMVQAMGLLEIARLAMKELWEARPTMKEVADVIARLVEAYPP